VGGFEISVFKGCPFIDYGKFAKNLEAEKTYLIMMRKECGACLEL
jgi:hypothetical protein